MQFGLPIMNWVLSDSPNHKAGCVQQHSIMKGKWYVLWLGQRRPKDTSKLHEEVAQMPMIPTSAPLPSLTLSCTYGLVGRSLSSADRGGEDLGLVYRGICTICRHHLKVDSCNNIALSGTSLKDSGEGKFSQWAKLGAVSLGVHYAWKKKWRGVYVYTDSWAMANDLDGWSGT